MLDPGITNNVIEMLSKNLKPDQINEIGKLIIKKFDMHTILGLDHHITVSKRRAAATLIEQCAAAEREDELFKLLIELDGSDLMGQAVNFAELEAVMNDLAKRGYVYDDKKRKMKRMKEDVDELPNWGVLRAGKTYEMTIVSLDIVGNSKLVKEHGIKKAEKLYFKFWSFLRRVLAVYEGRIWHWAGDGGILAFTFASHPVRAVMFAMEIQHLLPVFNIDPDRPILDELQLRVGIDTGKIKFDDDTGKIVSDTINYAAHLEKTFTGPGCISVSDKVLKLLPDGMRAYFSDTAEFEGRKACTMGPWAN
jgi:class 3 adenylate cyclase